MRLALKDFSKDKSFVDCSLVLNGTSFALLKALLFYVIIYIIWGPNDYRLEMLRLHSEGKRKGREIFPPISPS